MSQMVFQLRAGFNLTNAYSTKVLGWVSRGKGKHALGGVRRTVGLPYSGVLPQGGYGFHSSYDGKNERAATVCMVFQFQGGCSIGLHG